MKQFNGYNETRSYSEIQQLPKGAYILKILNAEEKASPNGGSYIQISCDIAEGEYKDFFMNDYKSQDREDKKWHCNYLLNEPVDDGSERDGWTKRRFKTVVEALEESNENYHWDWDEKKWAGKMIGGLFNIRQYRTNNGEIREATNLGGLCSVEAIRTGTYRIPRDRMLADAPAQTAAPTDAFMPVPDSVDLPWATE